MKARVGRWGAAGLVALVCWAGTRIAVEAAAPSRRLPDPPQASSPRSTTDATLALANLEGSLTALDQKLKTGGAPLSRRAELAELLMIRAQFLGRLSDTERAAAIALTLVGEEPGNGLFILLRGRTKAALHLFQPALRDFAAAGAAGADPNAVNGARASVLQAIGRVDEALAIREALARAKPDILSLGSLAVAQGEGGDLAAATETFRRARNAYRDVSPFPLAWIYFQEGKLNFAASNLERARALFAAAVDQLPAYSTAAGHLGEVEAALGRRGEAAQRLRLVAVAAEDPDSQGQLCRILIDLGQSEGAQACRVEVTRRYEALLKRHPEAFWDHAAEFFLAMHEPARALGFARQNLALRPSRAAFELFAKTARAAGASAEAGAAGRRSRSLERHHSPGAQPDPSDRDGKAGPRT